MDWFEQIHPPHEYTRLDKLSIHSNTWLKIEPSPLLLSSDIDFLEASNPSGRERFFSTHREMFSSRSYCQHSNINKVCQAQSKFQNQLTDYNLELPKMENHSLQECNITDANSSDSDSAVSTDSYMGVGPSYLLNELHASSGRKAYHRLEHHVNCKSSQNRKTSLTSLSHRNKIIPLIEDPLELEKEFNQVVRKMRARQKAMIDDLCDSYAVEPISDFKNIVEIVAPVSEAVKTNQSKISTVSPEEYEDFLKLKQLKNLNDPIQVIKSCNDVSLDKNCLKFSNIRKNYEFNLKKISTEDIKLYQDTINYAITGRTKMSTESVKLYMQMGSLCSACLFVKA